MLESEGELSGTWPSARKVKGGLRKVKGGLKKSKEGTEIGYNVKVHYFGPSSPTPSSLLKHVNRSYPVALWTQISFFSERKHYTTNLVPVITTDNSVDPRGRRGRPQQPQGK